MDSVGAMVWFRVPTPVAPPLLAVRTPPLPEAIVSGRLVEKSWTSLARPVGAARKAHPRDRGLQGDECPRRGTRDHTMAQGSPPGPPRTDPSRQPDTGAPCRRCVRAGMSVPARIAGSSHRGPERLELLTGRDRPILRSGAMARIGDAFNSLPPDVARPVALTGGSGCSGPYCDNGGVLGRPAPIRTSRPALPVRTAVRRFSRPPVPPSTIALPLGNRVPRRAASVAGSFPAPQTRMLFSVTDPALDTLMKLSIAKLAKRADPDAPHGRLFALSGKPVPVVTAEDRARMEAAARRRNDGGKYPIFHKG